MKYSLLFFVLQILVTSLHAACTGNSLGTCTDADPSACSMEKVVVGNSLTDPKDVTVERTSFGQYPVPFMHDGASGAFAVSLVTEGNDSGTSMTEEECNGKLVVFFSQAGNKSVRVKVNQTMWGRNLTSVNAFNIVYDNIPPVVQISRIFLSDTIESGDAGLLYSAGTTYYTSNEISIRARVTDPSPSQSAANLRMKVVDGLAQQSNFFTPIDETSGQFEFPLGVAQQPEGEYMVRVAASDGPDGGNFQDGSPGNLSDGQLIRVVKDETQPVLLSIDVIKEPDSSSPVIEAAPGVYIKDGTVRVRATFNEELKSPPSLMVEQQGNGEGDAPAPFKATYDTELFKTNPSVVEYVFAPLVGPNNIGPVTFTFSEDGYDRSGNPLDLTKGMLKNGESIERAVIVDTVPPDLNRIYGSTDGKIQSIPANNERLSKDEFPSRLLIIVQDYNQLDDNTDDELNLKVDNASGVDFEKVGNSDDGVYVEFLNPDDDPIPGTLATQPPNGLIYLLPSKSTLYPGEPGKPDTIGVPPEGVYTVRVHMVDKVGNVAVETFYFTMDTTDIRPDSVQVSILPAGEEGTNPYLENPIGGKSIPDTPDLVDLGTLDAVNTLQELVVCSTDSSFNMTESVIQLRARLNGPDTVGRILNSTSQVEEESEDATCGGGSALRLAVGDDQKTIFPDLNFAFPNPDHIGNQVRVGERDPRFGRFDGPYSLEVEAVDDAGNQGDVIKKEFLLDTMPPYTDEVFPTANTKINTPLRHVSAVVVDPHPPKNHTFDEDGFVNFGSGISVTQSGMKVYLDTPYAGSLDTTYYNSDGLVRGSLSFIHNPNSMDPDSPSYDAKDDAYRILLEFADKLGNTVSLPTDGSADGIYRMEIAPADNAGNSIDNAMDGSRGGYNTSIENESTRPKELTKNFYFLLDTKPPTVKVNPVGGEEVTELKVSGQNFVLSGTTRDLSSRSGDDALKGGAGIKEVLYDVVYLAQDGTLIQPSSAEYANPILADVSAELAAISDSSKDPVCSSTKPMDPTSYPDMELEERAWSINGTLPSFDKIISDSNVNANYWLRIKSYDYAGNVTEKLVKMRLKYGGNFGVLSAPEQLAPLNDVRFSSAAVTFQWKAVDAAAKYMITISNPNGESTTHEVLPGANETEDLSYPSIFNREGQYSWWVQASDSVGNVGQESFHWVFYRDKTSPVISSMSWNNLSPGTNGRLTLGQFDLTLIFSEDLMQKPEVTFDPFSQSIGKQTVTTIELQGNSWTGRVVIPEDADYNWDGMAILEVKGAKDKAGNTMVMDRSRSFEIDTGPSYEVKFFTNPVASSEIILVLKASERLMTAPTIFQLQGVTALQEQFLGIADRTFSMPFKLNGSSNQDASFNITAADLLGNSSTRAVTFPVSSMKVNSSISLAGSRIKVELPAGVLPESSLVALLPENGPVSEGDSSVNASFSRINASSEELVKLREMEALFSPGQELTHPVTGYFLAPLALNEQEALFLEDNRGSLHFIPVLTDSRFSIPALGRFSVYKDTQSPKISFDDTVLLSSRYPEVDFEVMERGSGLAEFKVSLNEEELSCEQDETRLHCNYSGVVSPGEVRLSASAVDNVGNRSVLSTNAIVAGPVRIRGNVYPNPARNFATVRYQLSRSVASLKLSIYDAAGHRVHFADSSSSILGMQAGEHRYRWDLFSDSGSEIANGVYICILKVTDSEGNADQIKLKLAVLR